MKRLISKRFTRIIIAVAFVCVTCSCLRQDLVFFEDGEWDISDYRENSERLLMNSDIDNDDTDR